MKKPFIVILILLFSNSALYSQTFEDKINLYLSAGICNTMGKKDINENNYITPSLYANYEKGFNFNLKGTYKIKPMLSLGFQLKSIGFSGWSESSGSDLYSGSESKIITFGALIKFHSKFQMQGFFNQAKIYAEIKPVFGQAKLMLENPVVYTSFTNSDSPMESNCFTWGAETSIGMEYAFSNSMGVLVDFTFVYNKVDSPLYNDKSVIYAAANLGVYIRLFKNKHYY